MEAAKTFYDVQQVKRAGLRKTYARVVVVGAEGEEEAGVFMKMRSSHSHVFVTLKSRRVQRISQRIRFQSSPPTTTSSNCMSPFYTRSSTSRPKSSQAQPTNVHQNSHTDYSLHATYATITTPLEPVNEPRKSSKMRIPFLGKRRKSLAALNTSAPSATAGHARNATASLSVQE